jgi:hypothetical protein
MEVIVLEMKKEVGEHLRKHIVYPTTKKEIVEACNHMMDIPDVDKQEFERLLPDWNYRNADEIVRAVEVSEHLGHVSYPTTKKDLIKACNKMSDVPKADKEWFERSLPDRTYGKPEEVLGTLKGVTHIREHVSYPANKMAIVETCHNMTEVPETEKMWFEKYLPEKNYNNPDDVIKALR